MKDIALKNKHLALGAKMLPFAGYNMPIQYSGVNDEHFTVRNAVGVFDVSHMGEFLVKGPHAFDLIQYVCSNDASKLSDGKVQYACLPNGKGGIVDDLLVYRLNEEEYMLVVNASNIEKDWNWINKQNTFGANLENISDSISLLAVQGPKALQTLQKLTDVNLADIPYYSFKKGTFAGLPDILLSNTGYTGAGGFEIYCKNHEVEKIWDAVFEAGKDAGIKPIGLGARDTLRLEMGFCLYGNDIDDTTSPLEAGLGWITKFSKNFIDAEYLKAQKESGIKNKLCGFIMREKGGIARHEHLVCNTQGETIGRVTSGTMSPSLKEAIGLAYVPAEMAKPGNEIYIQIREKLLKAEVVKLPFIQA